jgi:succinyl-CoA synthetase alpha subunit
MIERVVVHKNRYQDSARLMRLSGELGAMEGIADAQVLMGTQMNQALLQEAGFTDPALEDVTPMDLLVALRGASEQALEAATAELSRLLQAQPTLGAGAGGSAVRASSLEDALSANPEINLVSIAVPGAYAAYVARKALHTGRHVFLFSDNVPLADEVALKTRAAEDGLLLMGPDCGTAIIAGVGLGFANRVRRGAVGLVGASGTGIQEITSRVHQLGHGVSHAIGTGSRDLHAEVDGRMTHLGVRLLAQDPDTEVIVVVAKQPDSGVADRLHRRLTEIEKPVVVRYLGQAAGPAAGQTNGQANGQAAGQASGQTRDGVLYAVNLEEASREAVARLADSRASSGSRAGWSDEIEAARRTLLGDAGRVTGRLVGLFGGGSLASEAALALRSAGLEVLIPEQPLPTHAPPGGSAHLVVDVGDDFYTVGRPHPMVDQTTRCDLIRSVGRDPGVGLLLLDLVLGDGAHPDPAPEIRDALETAQKSRGAAPLLVVASVTGTDHDPQGRARQQQILASGGIAVQPSATHAAQLAAALMRGEQGERSA